MNPITEKFEKGCFGELLVQLRLLQYGVQAAPPLKDTGNDLIAIKSDLFRAIQVKARTLKNNRISIDRIDRKYHILAIVVLDPDCEDYRVKLDNCWIFFLSADEAKEQTSFDLNELKPFTLSFDRIEKLFS